MCCRSCCSRVRAVGSHDSRLQIGDYGADLDINLQPGWYQQTDDPDPALEGEVRVQPCLLARKACLHAHHGRLLLHLRCSQTHILRVHASDERVQGYKHRVPARIRRLLGYTDVALLCTGVSWTNKHGWWTNKHGWWTGSPSSLPVFPDSSAVYHGCAAASSFATRPTPPSMAGKSRCRAGSRIYIPMTLRSRDSQYVIR